MSDFLDRMASRSQGAAAVLRPRPLSLYEGGPDLFEEVHAEREAGPAAAPATSAPPARAARRSHEPGPVEGPADSGPDPIPGPWAEEAPARAQRSPVSSPFRPVPDEAVRSPLAAAPGEAAAPAPDRAPPAAAAMPAAIVRRRAAEAATGPVSWAGAAPFADSPEAPRIDPDRERPAPAAARLAEPFRSEIATLRSDPSGRAAPPAAPPAFGAPAPAAARASAAARGAGETAAAPESLSRPVEARAPQSRAVPPRPVAPPESLAPSAGPAQYGASPFPPRSETAQAPAPVEIRIGRIDIHAAPPAAQPAAPVAAPGPSLDAFLARPRR